MERVVRRNFLDDDSEPRDLVRTVEIRNELAAPGQRFASSFADRSIPTVICEKPQKDRGLTVQCGHGC